MATSADWVQLKYMEYGFPGLLPHLGPLLSTQVQQESLGSLFLGAAARPASSFWLVEGAVLKEISRLSGLYAATKSPCGRFLRVRCAKSRSGSSCGCSFTLLAFIMGKVAPNMPWLASKVLLHLVHPVHSHDAPLTPSVKAQIPPSFMQKARDIAALHPHATRRALLLALQQQLLGLYDIASRSQNAAFLEKIVDMLVYERSVAKFDPVKVLDSIQQADTHHCLIASSLEDKLNPADAHWIIFGPPKELHEEVNRLIFSRPQLELQADATHGMAPGVQVFNIVFRNVCLFRVVMKKVDYNSFFFVFRAIELAFPSFQPKWFVVDADMSVRAALRKVFTGTQVFLCSVHVWKNLCRQVVMKIRQGTFTKRLMVLVAIHELLFDTSPLELFGASNQRLVYACKVAELSMLYTVLKTQPYSNNTATFANYLMGHYGFVGGKKTPFKDAQFPISQWCLALRPSETSRSTNAIEGGTHAVEKRGKHLSSPSVYGLVHNICGKHPFLLAQQLADLKDNDAKTEARRKLAEAQASTVSVVKLADRAEEGGLERTRNVLYSVSVCGELSLVHKTQDGFVCSNHGHGPCVCIEATLETARQRAAPRSPPTAKAVLEVKAKKKKESVSVETAIYRQDLLSLAYRNVSYNTNYATPQDDVMAFLQACVSFLDHLLSLAGPNFVIAANCAHVRNQKLHLVKQLVVADPLSKVLRDSLPPLVRPGEKQIDYSELAAVLYYLHIKVKRICERVDHFRAKAEDMELRAAKEGGESVAGVAGAAVDHLSPFLAVHADWQKSLKDIVDMFGLAAEGIAASTKLSLAKPLVHHYSLEFTLDDTEFFTPGKQADRRTKEGRDKPLLGVKQTALKVQHLNNGQHTGRSAARQQQLEQMLPERQSKRGLAVASREAMVAGMGTE